MTFKPLARSRRLLASQAQPQILDSADRLLGELGAPLVGAALDHPTWGNRTEKALLYDTLSAESAWVLLLRARRPAQRDVTHLVSGWMVRIKGISGKGLVLGAMLLGGGHYVFGGRAASGASGAGNAQGVSPPKGAESSPAKRMHEMAPPCTPPTANKVDSMLLYSGDGKRRRIGEEHVFDCMDPRLLQSEMSPLSPLIRGYGEGNHGGSEVSSLQLSPLQGQGSPFVPSTAPFAPMFSMRFGEDFTKSLIMPPKSRSSSGTLNHGASTLIPQLLQGQREELAHPLQ
ncbi:hypothetical protein T484DRAFT_1839516, partial [Baffinella frigidus]